MFHIGVLAPTLRGGAEFLRRVRSHGSARSDMKQHPELTLSWAPLGTDSDRWRGGDPETIRAQLVLSAARLRQAGADFFVCSDDTAYGPLDSMDAVLALPGLHVAAVVASEAQRHGWARVGILGTRWTLDCSRYADEFDPKGITAVAMSLRDQTTLHSIVHDELVHDRYLLTSRDTVLDIIQRMQGQGCEAVVLGGSELTSLVTPASSPLPLLEPTALLAEVALSVATGDAPLPRWRGGPAVKDLVVESLPGRHPAQ